ncbi:MAG: YidC/Oxa1 family membrane protein insertase [Candidatus Buchananbacteria bacterium]|nr:YidC/Oxa1 family membrane protein insertase [Candidatus Buchananbacteria bacterium]
MEILNYIWEFYLYIPLFNFLVWLYLTYSWFNLGISVIILTILLRFALLPFSILTEKGKLVSMNLGKEVAEIKKDFANDPVKQKQMIRNLLKKKKIRPWAKAIVLGVQGLVLLLLYQVFLGGINTEAKLHLLYPDIPRPDFINTKFLWFDIAQQDLVASALVAGYIFAQSLIGAYNRKGKLSKKEQIFLIFFPAFIFLILAVLPSVKSIFVLTSFIFSSIISMFTAIIKIMITQAKKKPQSS